MNDTLHEDLRTFVIFHHELSSKLRQNIVCEVYVKAEETVLIA
jgi:hypothetical protein